MLIFDRTATHVIFIVSAISYFLKQYIWIYVIEHIDYKINLII